MKKRDFNGKTCKTCRKKRPYNYFDKKPKGFGLRAHCKKCTHQTTAPYQSAYYRQTTINRRKAIKTYIRSYLETHPCVDCGNSNPIVLDFDHVRGKKEFNLACATKNNATIERIDNEISKCEIRCANCHRIVTHNRRLQASLCEKKCYIPLKGQY